MTKPLLNLRWVSFLEQFRRLFVGFSGGLDSTVLLHALVSQPTLRNKLIAVHVNHGLSPNASLWQAHCEAFCLDAGVAFIAQQVEFDRQANIEEGARNARYEVFISLMDEHDCLVLGHHQDDQAETVLLQLFRGAGVDGLAAMMESGNCGSGRLARPLLASSRKQLEHYADCHQLSWIEDESNQDEYYSRNFIRQQIIPSLTAKWPGVVGNIARAALHCQQARTNLDALAFMDCCALSTPANLLALAPLKSLSVERINNVLRVWLKNNQVRLPSAATFQRLINEAVLASEDANPLISWDKVQIRRYHDTLYLLPANSCNFPVVLKWDEFPKPLYLGDTGFCLSAKKTKEGIRIPQDAVLHIQFRQGGETFFWHGQTKQLKKLFQDWQVPPWLRQNIPLLYINDQLAAIIGYAVSDRYYTQEASEAWTLLMNQSSQKSD
ncbi:tRNA lysidine(34) synthetase TilS [Legionella worsleiensis]|uniref:tRNA(Ile)-lysidine synthase n=1 Tax=Legionella worsleiensis TaxID=45076 RepID=A0A0W1A3L7_9GAMM|nr:tRNA lysidine(34) synthetase TilS [Legionella worsleiensis]KTD75894.1 cell cycle protein MesJ [Legionella worsleiensis]STY32907.1 cell cycle protein MesJ [Legionella worsleiensis]